MAHLFRLIAIGLFGLLACVLLLQPLRAHAAFAPNTYTCTARAANGVFGPPSATCSQSAEPLRQYYSPPATLVCNLTRPATSPCTINGFELTVTWSAASCPANSTLASGQCSCNSGYVELSGACVQPDVAYCAAQQALPGGVTTGVRPSGVTGLTPFNLCYSNPFTESPCMTTFTPDICGQGEDGRYYCTGRFAYSGGPCTGDPDPGPGETPAPLPDPPPAGYCPGTVNGVPVNVPCGTTETGGSKTVETDDGTNNTVTTTTSSTVCTAGSCITTTTTNVSVNGGAPTTTTSETTEPRDDYCTQNPRALECRDSTFGGSCASGFTCQGDAIQCASARKLHEVACFVTQASAESALYDAEKNPAGGPADIPSDTVDVGPGSLEAGNALGVAACIPDLALTVAGTAVSLPLSNICPYLAHLRLMLLAVAWLMAFRIVARD